MVEPGRREAASAGNSMMVPMFRSFWLPPGTIWPATCHYSEQNVVNGILICAGGTVTGSPAPAAPAESSHFIGFLHGLFSLTNS
jgi:hypothetical protein